MKVELVKYSNGQYSLRLVGYPLWVEEGVRWTYRSSAWLLLITPSFEEVMGVIQSVREETDLRGRRGDKWVAPSSLHHLLPGEWSYPQHNAWDDPQEEDWAPTPEELLDEHDFHYTSYKERVDGEKEDDGEWGGFVRTHSRSQRETPKQVVRKEARKERTLQRKGARRAKSY